MPMAIIIYMTIWEGKKMSKKCYVVVEHMRLDDYSHNEVKAVFAKEGEAEQCASRWDAEARRLNDPMYYFVEEVNYYE